MLFNSLEFVFLFLPLVWSGFVLLARRSNRASLLWLSAASFVFYGTWDWRYTALLGGSTLANFVFGHLILRGSRYAGAWCAAGVIANLTCLAVFKYADFIVGNLGFFLATTLAKPEITLPPGISFFTFTQIAFLVDARRGAVRERLDLPSYSLFVNWFPHLIAGPVLHHAKMIPQFHRIHGDMRNDDNVAAGLFLFALGMGKKLLLADNLALLASPVFDSAAQGMEPSFVIAWFAAVAYAFQIYFDFSGYSDMAVGLSRLFNVELPINFASPYKATSIVDFWRRWHISLSSFLRDYLYIPLGGNRKGPVRRHLNLMITMLLGGLWHGASWGFVLWGGLHGLLLIINHVWQARPLLAWSIRTHPRRVWIEGGVCLALAALAFTLPGNSGWITLVLLLAGWVWRHHLAGDADAAARWPGRVLGIALTFTVVTICWVFFRAANLIAVREMLQGMFFAHGFSHHQWADFSHCGVLDVIGGSKVLFVAALIVWLGPDSNRVTALLLRAGLWGALAAGLLLYVCLLHLGKPSEFLYFQF